MKLFKRWPTAVIVVAWVIAILGLCSAFTHLNQR